MSDVKLERAIGSAIIALLVGIGTFYVSAFCLIICGLVSGRSNLTIFPTQSEIAQAHSWDAITFTASLAVAFVTAILTFRHCLELGERSKPGMH